MFSNSRSSFSKHRAGKNSSKKKSSFRQPPAITTSRRYEAAADHALAAAQQQRQQQQQLPTPATGSSPAATGGSPTLTSAIVTLSVGREQRLFAAHEDVLAHSPFFAQLLRTQFFDSTKRLDLPDEEPEVFSCVLEYLYKGDYFPRLEYNKKRQSYSIEAIDPAYHAATIETTVVQNGIAYTLLKDTVVYCTALRFGLPALQKIALRKQGLQSGIQCSTILTSARYAYANTPDNDSKLRAHYLALIIRSRNTFKRSGTMQAEMEAGGKMWFDLFVSMVNHMDDLAGSSKSPR